MDDYGNNITGDDGIIKNIMIKNIKLPAHDIPFVINESISRQLEKASILFTIIVICCIFIFIFIFVEYHKYSHHLDNIDNGIPSLKSITDSTLLKSMPCIMNLQQIDIFHIFDHHYQDIFKIENIVLLDNTYNVIDIDPERNYFMTKTKIKNGILYSINFGKELSIKEMTIIQSSHNTSYKSSILHINGYNSLNDKTWQYSGILHAKKETTIPLTCHFI